MSNASRLRAQKYDIEEYLMKHNFFNRPKEEIKQIFQVMMSTFITEKPFDYIKKAF